MKDVEYGDFSDDLFATMASFDEKDRVPLNGMIELTRLCSLKCTHCYIGDSRWIPDKNELTTAEVKSLIDTLAARGTLWLCFTGGEAMIRKDFKELWLYAKSKGFIMTLFTNATLISESMAAFLLENPPFNIEVSIYGASEQTYERVTQIKGSFKRFIRGIDNLAATGLPWKLKSVLIEENKHEIEAMNELATHYGVTFRFDGNINPSIGTGETAGMAPCASRVENEDFVKAEMQVVGHADEAGALFESQSQSPGKGDQLYYCGAGQSSFYVNANGGLQMCLLTAHRAHDLKAAPSMNEAFDAGWKNFAIVREVKRAADSPCRTCDIATLCENCPGFAHLETGDENGAVEWLCRNTHLKAQAMGIKHRCDISHFVYSKPKRIIEKSEANHANHER